MTTGQRIKHMRQMQGMTLQQLGDLVGVGKSTIRKWEEGIITGIKAESLSKLATALRCSPNYLVGTTEDPALTFDVALTSEERELILNYRKTDDLSKIAIKRLLDYSMKEGMRK